MKKNLTLRMMSVGLSITLLLSLYAGIVKFSASAEQITFTEDFESAASLTNWEAVNFAATVPAGNTDMKLVTSGENTFMQPMIKNTGTAADWRATAYVFKKDVVPGSFTQKIITGKFKVDPASQFTMNMPSNRFLLGLDTNGNAAGTCAARSGSYTLQIGTTLTYDKTSTSAEQNVDFQGPTDIDLGISSTITSSEWLDFQFIITPKINGKYNCEVTYKNANGQSKVYNIEIASVTAFGIFVTNTTDTATAASYDDIKIVYETEGTGSSSSSSSSSVTSSSSAVSSSTSSSSEDKNPGTVIVQPTDTTEYATGALFTGDDFESASDYWIMQGSSTGTPDFNRVLVDGNYVLKPSGTISPDTHKDLIYNAECTFYENLVYTIKNQYWNENAVMQQVTGHLTLSTRGFSATDLAGIYYMYDPENGIYDYLQIWIDQETGKIKARGDGYWINPTESSPWYDLDPTGGVDFTISYVLNNQTQKYDCSLTLTDKNGISGTREMGSYTATGRFAICGDAIAAEDSTYAIDDIKVSAYVFDTNSQIEFQEEFDEFYKAYGAVLRLNENTISNLDADIISEADAAFQSLSIGAQARYSAYGDKLKTVKALLSNVNTNDDPSLLPVQGQYADFIEDFESMDCRKWVDAFEKSTTLKIEYNAELGSKVLRLNGGATGLMIKPWFIADKARITTIQYKAKIEPEKPEGFFHTVRFIYSFVDENNWAAIDFYADDNNDNGNIKGQLYWRTMVCSDGNLSGTYKAKSELNLNSWLDISVSISDNNTAIISISDGTENFQHATSVSTLQGTFALFAVGAYSGWNKYDILYDDITVTYEEGDWDEDLNNKSIVVYYEGNTFVNPGDIITLHGDNAGRNIREISVMHLENDISVDMGYIAEQTYERSTTSSIYTAPVAASWDDNKAQSVSILQKTNYSVKFRLRFHLF